MTRQPFTPGPETRLDQAVRLETDLSQWHTRLEACMAERSRIIAFRGAGSVSGINPGAAEVMGQMLHNYITDITAAGVPVVLMYDGDRDLQGRPDLGSVFGRLADSLVGNDRVRLMAVQTTDWYEPAAPSAPLTSATGTPYETYVFSSDLPDIDPSLSGRGLAHSALTQSDALVAYEGYEQIIVGPAGPITTTQLHDLARKAHGRSAEAGPLRVTVLTAPINPGLDEGLRASADNPAAEPAKRDWARAKLAQRQNYPYGMLCTPTGEFALQPTDYPNIAFQVIPIS